MRQVRIHKPVGKRDVLRPEREPEDTPSERPEIRRDIRRTWWPEDC
ncbi:hypothetical protein [Streptomyces sp. NPDC050738]